MLDSLCFSVFALQSSAAHKAGNLNLSLGEKSPLGEPVCWLSYLSRF